jgi:hypothetical protein
MHALHRLYSPTADFTGWVKKCGLLESTYSASSEILGRSAIAARMPDSPIGP